MTFLEVIKRRKYLVGVVGIFLFGVITWIYLINPASDLKNIDLDEVGIYAANGRSLWELGFSEEDFTEAKPGTGDFEYNAIFKGEALEKIKNALRSEGRSYYLFGEPNIENRLYVINIPITDNEGFTFVVPSNIMREATGNLIGYRYTSLSSGDVKWIGYVNENLGEVLMELRTKNW